MTLLPTNFSFNRLSKPTRKSSFLASPMGLPVTVACYTSKTLLIEDLAQIAYQNEGSHLGNAGLMAFSGLERFTNGCSEFSSRNPQRNPEIGGTRECTLH